MRVAYDFTKVTNVALFGFNPWVFKSLSESRYQNYTHSAPQTASGSAYLAAPTPPSHSSPLWGLVSRLTQAKAKAVRFSSSSSAFSSSALRLLLSPRLLSPLRPTTTSPDVRQTRSPRRKQSAALAHPGQRETSICRGGARGGPGCQPIRERPWRPFVRATGDEWRRTMKSVPPQYRGLFYLLIKENKSRP